MAHADSYRTTRRDIEAAYKGLRRERDKNAARTARAGQMMGKGVRTLSTIAGGAAVAYGQTRYGFMGLGPVPTPLLAGAALLGVSMLTSGRLSDVAEGAANGALTAYAVGWAAELGTAGRQRAAVNAAIPQPAATAGWGYAPAAAFAPPGMGIPGMPLSQEEVMAGWRNAGVAY